jgi:hypothetical protein
MLTPPPFSNRPRLIVAGTADGALSAIARELKARLDTLLRPNQLLQIDLVGGQDGVTAANQFEANVAPDGETALMVSGAAALAWLQADQRAQFDIGHWLPLATAQVSGVVFSTDSGLKHGPVLRLVVETTAASVLSAQLGLHILGRNVTSIVTSGDPIRALAEGRADLAFLVGQDTKHRAFEAIALGMKPVFTLGSLDTANQIIRDPNLPNLPTLLDVLADHQITADPALLAAWRCLSAASRLEVAVLLPWLTPADLVAWWRMAVQEIQLRNLLGEAERVVWHTDPTDNFGLTAMIADTQASLALHRWLASLPK